MSKRGYISRYLLILKKLKTKPFSTYEELQSYIEHQFNFLQMQDDTLNVGLSKRTFQRDIREISNLFGINIEYSKTNRGYYIHQSESENMNFHRMMEAFDLFNSLNLAHDFTPYIHLESRRPQGTENLYGLLHAIKNRFKIKFDYQKFWEDELSHRIVEPYALKEFKNRWYLMAKSTNEPHVKSFALDRLTNLEITTQHFQYPKDYNVEQSYRYCFGIINPEELEPQNIVLSFNTFQGKYIKTLPLHTTQKIILENEKETRIQLKLRVTHDFIMELLSFGDKMKILKPKSLANQIKQAHKSAWTQY